MGSNQHVRMNCSLDVRCRGWSLEGHFSSHLGEEMDDSADFERGGFVNFDNSVDFDRDSFAEEN